MILTILLIWIILSIASLPLLIAILRMASDSEPAAVPLKSGGRAGAPTLLPLVEPQPAFRDREVCEQIPENFDDTSWGRPASNVVFFNGLRVPLHDCEHGGELSSCVTKSLSGETK